MSATDGILANSSKQL